MIRIKKPLSNRVVKQVLSVAGALAVLLWSSGTANAAIDWGPVQMVVQASQQCLEAQGDYVFNGETGATTPGCMARGTSQVWLTSERPDDNGHAIVWIATHDTHGMTVCLTAGYPHTGPNGANSTLTKWVDCGSTGDLQLWTMETAALPQDVGNPAGLKHFINFYNAAGDVCLDGGWGVYGFAGQCSTTNDWQIWNIYTNKGSQPFGG